MSKEKCEVGCMVYHGGEIRHHVNCVFYPESLTEMHHEMQEQLESAREVIENKITYPECDYEFVEKLVKMSGNEKDNIIMEIRKRNKKWLELNKDK